ncbi:MAG: DeoR/GlpR family DNA-binding transcription regulator [Planctomycetaceae bacterium]|nr:DeoR/GlpR family DNA-binding transcription regulator [Planctomycetaceae bacterium]
MSTRRSEVLKMIRARDSIGVNELIDSFDVSPATLRKDLTYLAEQGLIVRSRGEVHVASKSTVTPFESRSVIEQQGKMAIARAAAALIEDNDSIILDSGTTTNEIAKLLVNRSDVTVLTNSLPAAFILVDSNCSVLLAGGILFKQNVSTQGPEAEEYISRVEMNKVFIAASGVRSTIGLAASSPFEESLKRRLIQSAKTVYAVLDHTKFSKSSIYLFADFDDIDYIITDREITDPAFIERFEEANVQVIVAGE